MNDLTLALRDLIRDIVTEDLALIAGVASIIAAFFLVWLLLRGPRLWYWKVNGRAGTLKKIDERLKNIERLLIWTSTPRKQIAVAPAPMVAMAAAPAGAAMTEPMISTSNAEMAAGSVVQGLHSDPAAAAAMAEMSAREEAAAETISEIETYRGKSGKVYSRKDLEEQIRD